MRNEPIDETELEIAQGCPSYPPVTSYRAAIEVNAGCFANHGISPDSRLLLADMTRRLAASARRGGR